MRAVEGNLGHSPPNTMGRERKTKHTQCVVPFVTRCPSDEYHAYNATRVMAQASSLLTASRGDLICV